MAAWLNSLPGSAKTAANKHGFLAGALNAAVRAKHLSANPCDGNRMRRDAPSEMVFLTHEEFALLHSCISEHWQPLVEFLVASGARFGEATALKPGDINLAEGTVDIRRAWRYVVGEGFQLGPPKTKRSVRTIDVAATTHQMPHRLTRGQDDHNHRDPQWFHRPDDSHQDDREPHGRILAFLPP